MPQKPINSRTREANYKAGDHSKISIQHPIVAFYSHLVPAPSPVQRSRSTHVDTFKIVFKGYANMSLQSHDELPATTADVNSQELSGSQANNYQAHVDNKRRREERLNRDLQVSEATTQCDNSDSSFSSPFPWV